MQKLNGIPSVKTRLESPNFEIHQGDCTNGGKNFMIFQRKIKPYVLKENPSATDKEIKNAAERMWSEMSEQERLEVSIQK